MHTEFGKINLNCSDHLLRSMRKLQDNIKMDLKEIMCECTGLMSIRMGSSFLGFLGGWEFCKKLSDCRSSIWTGVGATWRYFS